MNAYSHTLMKQRYRSAIAAATLVPGTYLALPHLSHTQAYVLDQLAVAANNTAAYRAESRNEPQERVMTLRAKADFYREQAQEHGHHVQAGGAILLGNIILAGVTHTFILPRLGRRVIDSVQEECELSDGVSLRQQPAMMPATSQEVTIPATSVHVEV